MGENLSTKTTFSNEEKRELLSRVPYPDNLVLVNTMNQFFVSSLPISDEMKEGFEQHIKSETTRTKQRIQEWQANEEARRKFDGIEYGAFPTAEQLEEFKKVTVANYVQSLLNNENVGRDGEITFVIGSPGAGKSTTTDHLSTNKQAFHAEADHFKKEIAEKFGCDINHKDMHNVSVQFIEAVMADAMPYKLNIILEKIGDEPNQIYNMAKDFNAKGYKVDLNLVHVHEDFARQRNIDRPNISMDKGQIPRLVNDDFLKKVDDGPLFTYLHLCEECPEIFASCTAACNEIPFKEGCPPIPLNTLGVRSRKLLAVPSTRTADKISSEVSEMCAQAMGCALEGIAKAESDKKISSISKKFSSLFLGTEEEKHEVKASICQTLVNRKNGVEYSEDDIITLGLCVEADTLTNQTLAKIYDPKNVADREKLEEKPEECKGIVRDFMVESITGESHESDVVVASKGGLLEVMKGKVSKTLGYEKAQQYKKPVPMGASC